MLNRFSNASALSVNTRQFIFYYLNVIAALVLMTSSLAAQALTYNIPATSSTGTYTITWSGVRTYVTLSENGKSLTISGTSYTATGKTPGNYVYVLKDCWVSGTSVSCTEMSGTVVVTAPVPAAPASLSATVQGAGVDLSWTTSSGATSYNLQRDSVTILSANSTTFRDSSASLGVAHSYRVQACNAYNSCSGWTTAANVTIAAIPPVPTITTRISGSAIVISWLTSAGATIYDLERNNSILTSISAISYSDSPLAPTVSYTYRVRACNSTGCSAWSGASTLIAPSSAVNNSGELTNGYVNNTPITDKPSGIPVGTVAGQFRVNESGAATYSAALNLPSGVAGVAPKLSIDYSSQGGNGLLGQGWSLGGISAVSRCRQTILQDGVAKPISWNSDDRFCLDGQRLINVSGSYGAVGSQYRTEVDAGILVTAYGGAVGNPDYFDVEAKDGSHTIYGMASDSKLLAGSITMSWSIDYFRDNIGNSINYEYTGSRTDSFRLLRISYGFPAPNTQSAPAVIITFDYETRTDVTTSYLSGYSFLQGKRLTKVHIADNGSEIRRYDVGYRTTGRDDVLERLGECSPTACFPATAFTNVSDAIPYATSTSFDFSLGNYAHNLVYLDMNGDGILDMAWENQKNEDGKVRYSIDYAIGTGTGFIKPQNTLQSALLVADSGTRLKVIDFNADGRQDLIHYGKNCDCWTILVSAPQTDGTWNFSPYTSDGNANLFFGEPLGISGEKVLFGDADSDGLTDALFLSKTGELSLYKLIPQSAAVIQSQPQYQYKFSKNATYQLQLSDLPAGRTWAFEGVHETESPVDFNGDGRVDLVVEVSTFANVTTFNSATSQVVTVSVKQTVLMGYLATANGYSFYAPLMDVSAGALEYNSISQPRLLDINGDGLTDIVHPAKFSLNTGSGFSSYTTMPDSGMLADVNRDGYLDLISSYESDTFGNTIVNIIAYLWSPALNNFEASSIPITYYAKGSILSHSLMDTDGDGWVDVVLQDTSTTKIVKFTKTKSLRPNLVTRITDGLGNVTDIDYTTLLDHTHYTSTWGVNTTANTIRSCYKATTGTGSLYEVCENKVVTNSVPLQNAAQFYAALSKPFSYLGIDTRPEVPVLEVIGPMAVVGKVASTSPIPGSPSNQASVSYFYHHLRVQAGGRGSLGFEKLTTVDTQTGVMTETSYRQDWPYVGSPLRTTTKLFGGQLLSEANNEWSNEVLDNKRVKPYLRSSIEKSYLLGSNGVVSSDPLQTVTTLTTMASNDNGYGNIGSIKVTTQSGSDTLEKNTTNQYYSSDWEKRMGRLQSSTVTTTRNGVGDTARTVSFEYYPQGSVENGLLKKETVEENTAEQLRTEYAYDTWGNKIRVSVTGLADATRSETRNSFTAYDSNGRYVVSSTNDLSQTANITARDAASGQPTSINDINNISAQLRYDDMGKEYLRIDGSGAWKRTDTLFCSSNCPAGARFYTQTRVSGGGQTIDYADSLGRVIRQSKVGFNGQFIHVDTEYDTLGRVSRQSTPFYEGTSPVGWTTTLYDLLGRITKVTQPDNSVSITNFTRGSLGINSSITNPLGQTRTETRNGLGQLVQVTDNAGGTITYTYNMKGDLLSATTAAPSAPTVTVWMCYDRLGRKTSMLDPDKGGWLSNLVNSSPTADICTNLPGSAAGWWRYSYNAFGELITQQDPKSQATTMVYDQLGRLIKRTEKFTNGTIDAHTRWYYDKYPNNTSSAVTQGKLTTLVVSTDGSETCAGNNQCTTYTYDSVARLSTTLLLVPDGSPNGYISSVKYDSIGRAYEQRDVLDGLILSSSGVQTQFNPYGYAYRTVDIAPIGGGSGVLSTIISVNARGQVTQELRGNGATTASTYNNYTGLLERQYATNALGWAVIQDDNYRWDSVGNLNYRLNNSANVGSTANKNLAESFCYDGLNRLVKTTAGISPSCGGTQDVSYDGLGNITSKAGVGSYAYGSNAGPHAVTNAGGVTYGYDANGNQISGDGRTITYTSYDRAKRISKSGNSSEFTYGADRSRLLRVDVKNGVTTTTTYLGNVERIVTAGKIEWKRYVGGIIITYTDNSNQLKSNTAYVYNDHLGSPDVITDATGKVTHSMSFDPWGTRRNGENWGALTESQRIASLQIGNAAIFSRPITQQGFTGHEMVDDMGIIHMNGRIYDAKLGRFLQADPFIQAAANTQSYNRYSYVLNNPLNATDPSGFNFLKKLWNEVRPFVGAIVTIGLAMTGVDIVLAGLIGGAVGAAVNGTNILQGAVFGAFSGAAGGTGGWQGFLVKGAIGGMQAEMGHDSFGHGFLAAGIGGLGGGQAFSFGGFIQSAVLGGIATEITGGKFKNGAASAAFMYAVSVGVQKIGAGGGFQAESANGNTNAPYDAAKLAANKSDAIAYLTKVKSLLQGKMSASTLANIKAAYLVSPGDAEFGSTVNALITNIDNTLAGFGVANFQPVNQENLKQVLIGGAPLTSQEITKTLESKLMANAFVYASDTNKNVFVTDFFFGLPAILRTNTLIHEVSHFHPNGILGGLTHPGDVRSSPGLDAINNPYNFSSFITSF